MDMARLSSVTMFTSLAVRCSLAEPAIRISWSCLICRDGRQEITGEIYMKVCGQVVNVLVFGVALVGALGLCATVPALSQGSGAWSVKAPMPAIRNEVAAASVNGKLYVFGGSVGGGRYDLTRNEEYDPAANTWRARKDLPSGANHMT